MDLMYFKLYGWQMLLEMGRYFLKTLKNLRKIVFATQIGSLNFALSAKKPIIATAVGGFKEILKDQFNSLYHQKIHLN